MSKPPTRWRAAVALAAAYALALHAILLGLVPVLPGGAAGGGAHVLCLPSGGAAPDLPAAPSHRHDGCCVLCAAHGLAPGPIPAFTDPVGYAAAALPAHAAVDALGRTERSPIVPRAPPPAA